MAFNNANTLVSYSDQGGPTTSVPQGGTIIAIAGDTILLTLTSPPAVPTGLIWKFQIQIGSSSAFRGEANLGNGQTQIVIQIPQSLSGRFISTITDGSNNVAYSTGNVSLQSAISGAVVASSVSPVVYTQSQPATGPGSTMRLRSNAAGTDTTQPGGDVSIMLGMFNGNPANGSYIRFGEATSLSDASIVEATPVNYVEYMKISRNSANNINLNIGGLQGQSVEISGQTQFSLATESTNTPTLGGFINMIPASRQMNGNMHASFYWVTNDDGAPLQQWNINNAPIGPQGTNSAGVSGFINWPFANSAVTQYLVAQRTSDNSSDIAIISRRSSTLIFGSLAEDHEIDAFSKRTHRLLAPNGGHQYIHQSTNTAATVTDLTISGDAQFSLVQGDVVAGTSDARLIQIYQQNTAATTAGTVIATIPIRTNGVHHLYARIQAKSGTDYAAFLHEWAVINSAGTVTIAPSQPAAIDKGHTAAAINIIPQFAVSGTNITITVTPWTATATHWTSYVESMVNMSSATAPATPTLPGSPSFLFNADTQGAGVANSLVDQSGNGRNFAVSGSGTIPSITATTGPNGVQNSLVLAASGRWYAIANGLGLGTKNFTMAMVWKVTNAATSQVGFQIGQSAGAWMGVSQAASGYRDVSMNPQGGNQRNVFGGLATTNWEIWVYTSDANGNLSLYINGKPQSVNPVAFTCVAANANSSIAANAASTGAVTGNIYLCASWATAQDPVAIYNALHALTGL